MRSMWMSGTGELLQFLVSFVPREGRHLLGRIIKPGPVAAYAAKQRFEARHQFVVGGLRAEGGVVGLLDPLGVATEANGVAAPARAQLVVVVAERLHRFFLQCGTLLLRKLGAVVDRL